MKILLIRHAKTSWNAQGRYQGSVDIPASEEGLSELHPADFNPEKVYITSKQRTRQTAEKIFPDAALVEVPGLEEMCFGVFEGRNYEELKFDSDYTGWLDSECESPIPNGESKSGFQKRIASAFEQLMQEAEGRDEENLVIVAHGGTQMALLEQFGQPSRKYHEWLAKNGSGYLLDASSWKDKHILLLEKEVSFTSI